MPYIHACVCRGAAEKKQDVAAAAAAIKLRSPSYEAAAIEWNVW